MSSVCYKAGERIRALREMNRYSREKFAEMVEISPKFLYEIETGLKGFSADTLYRVSRALSVNCDYIISGVDSNNHYSANVLEILKLFNYSQSQSIIKLLMAVYEIIYLESATRSGNSQLILDMLPIPKIPAEPDNP